MARGLGAYCICRPVRSNPARRMSSSIFRSKWQPPAMRRHAGVIRCCQRSILGSGESPCSTKQRWPFGSRTLRISRSAASGSGIEQGVHVITTVSMVSSASGIAVAEPSRSSTDTADAAARRRAIASNLGEGCRRPVPPVCHTAADSIPSQLLFRALARGPRRSPRADIS